MGYGAMGQHALRGQRSEGTCEQATCHTRWHVNGQSVPAGSCTRSHAAGVERSKMCMATKDGARSPRVRTCRILTAYVSILWAWYIASGRVAKATMRCGSSTYKFLIRVVGSAGTPRQTGGGPEAGVYVIGASAGAAAAAPSSSCMVAPPSSSSSCDGSRRCPCALGGVRRDSRSCEGLWREAATPVDEGGALAARVGRVRVTTAHARRRAGRPPRPLEDVEKSSALRAWHGGPGLGGLGDCSGRATTVGRTAAANAAATLRPIDRHWGVAVPWKA